MRLTDFRDPSSWPNDDLIAISTSLDLELYCYAMSHGAFPMPFSSTSWGWHSPLKRAIIPIKGIPVSRSLLKSSKRYVTTVNTAFEQVLDGCADPDRPYRWINNELRELFLRLHDDSLAISVESWTRDEDGNLVLGGGLIGVMLSGFFSGESMFHHLVHGRDASKVALLRLIHELIGARFMLLDAQWPTPHLASLGAQTIARADYLERIAQATSVQPGAIETVPIPGERIAAAHRAMYKAATSRNRPPTS